MTADTHLRLDSELKARLVLFAVATRRTLNASAALLLTEALDRRQRAEQEKE